ncbi:hypothetical protein MANES_S023153v8 [Manihot esculenta]|uniref:Uncharacterized protein n=1 Tax=Manihot esculenta TaxID=3983 RepID=A0ACB7FUF8_MANES|nr:hypothetical protein MANES_S023153v8 [Manihot esculenta]
MLHPVPDFGLIASIPKTFKSITHITSGARFRPNSFHPKTLPSLSPMLHPVPDFILIASIQNTAKSITHVTSGARFRPYSFHPKHCQVYHPCYIRCPISF